MAKALNELAREDRAGNSGKSGIAHLVQLMDEFLRVADTADEGAIEARDSGSDEGKLLAGTLSNLQLEADERADAIAKAIGALEPETLDDALAILVITYSELEIWFANFLPERPKQCASPADEVEAARVAAAERGAERIKQMLAAAIRGVDANGGKLPPLVHRSYFPPTPAWRQRISETFGKIRKD